MHCHRNYGTWFAEAVHAQIVGLQAAKVNVELANNAVRAVRTLMKELKPDTYGHNTLFATREEPPK